MSWQNENYLYLIMWKSPRSGATLSALRKSEEGKEKFIEALRYIGIPESSIRVKDQERAWKYVPASERKKNAPLRERRPLEERIEGDVQ